MQEPSVIAQCEQKYKNLNAIEVQLKQQRSLQEIDSLRQEYRDLCEDLTNLDIQFSVNRNIEDKLWRLVMYAKFEELRNRLKRSGTDENKTFLRRHLQQMDGFYNHRLRLLNVKLDISTGISMFVRSQSATSTDDDFRFKVISSHKCLVFLGDIARYRQQYLMNDKSYISAAHFYYKAIQINPCNGKPYSQLAMISGYQDDYLSLVYWYCQSIGNKQPSAIARENLNVFFQEYSNETRLLGTKSSNISSPKNDIPLIRSLLDFVGQCFMPKIEQIPLSNYQHLITLLETDVLPQNHDLEKMTIISMILAADLENRTSHADKSKDFVAKFHLKCSQILCVSFLLNFVTKLFAKAYESPTYIDNVTVSRSLNLLSCFFLRWMDNLKSLLSMEETAEVKSKLGEAQLRAGFGQFLSTSLRFLTKTGSSTAVAATFSPVYEDCLYCGLGFMEDFYRSFIQQSSLETQSVTLLLQEQSMRNLSFEQAMETRVNRLIVLLRLLAESDSFSFWSYSNGQFSMTSDDAAVKQTGNLQFGKALATQYLSAEVESLKTKVTRKHGKNIPVLGSDNLWKSRIVIVTADVLCSEKMALVKKWIDCRLATIVVPFHVIGNLDREKKSSAYAREAIRVFEGALRHPESVVKIEPQTHEELEEVPKEYRDCLGCANSWIRRGEKYVVVVSDDGKLKDLAEQLDVRVISPVECDNNLKER